MDKKTVKTDRSEKKNKGRIARRVIGIVLIVAAAAGIAGAVFLVVETIQGNEKYALFQTKHSSEESAKSYEDVLSTYYTALLDGDGAALVNIMAPPDYWTYYLDTYSKSEDDVIGSFTEMCDEVRADWENSYGAPIELSYQILGASEPDEEGLEEWDEQMEELIGSDALDILDAVTLEVALTVTGSNASDVLTYYPTIVQMGDSWYMLSDDSDELQSGS